MWQKIVTFLTIILKTRIYEKEFPTDIIDVVKFS